MEGTGELMVVTRFQSSSRSFLIIVLLGIVLMLPALRVGFLMDDYFYVLEESYFPTTENDGDLFAFYSGNAEATAIHAHNGHCPWWIDDSLRLAFLRPLSSLLLKLDAALFGLNPVGHHIHSLLWWGLTLLAVGIVLRRALPGAVGMLALLLFALDESHILPAMWIANRGAMVSLTCMLLGLWAHQRWREEDWRQGRWLAPLGIALGLLGGEVGVTVLAFFLAYELWGAPQSSLRTRVTALLPAILLGGAYVVIHRLLGYGSAGSGLYLDPGREPLAFLAGAVVRIPILLAGGIAGFSADLGIVDETLQPAQVVTGLVAIVVLTVLLKTCWPLCDERTRRGLRWLLPGSALALLPAVAVYPGDRMLLVPGLGLGAALAVVLHQAWLSWRGHRRAWLIGSGLLVFLIHVPMSAYVVVIYQNRVREFVQDTLAVTESPLLQEAQNREIVILNAPDHSVGLYVPLMFPFTQSRALESWRPLTMAPYDHTLRRPSARTLELEVAESGVMQRTVMERLYRNRAHRLQTGDVVDRGLFRAEILADNGEGPTRVAFHFDRDLEDDSLRILAWQEGELCRAILPSVGDEVVLQHTPGPVGY